MQYFRALQKPCLYRALIRETRFSFSNENKIADKIAEEFADILNNLKTAKNPGAITNILNDVISFRNPNNSELKYFRIVEGVSDPEVKGLVLSIKEPISDALLFGPQKQVKIADEVNSTAKALRIPFDANRSGKILDYMGRDIEKIDEPVVAENFKELFSKPTPINPFKKQVPNGQVFTGNIAIDLTDPIPVGSFAYFRGSNNTGKTLLALSTIHQYLSTNHFSKRNPGMKKAVYVNTSSNTVQKVARHLDDLEVLKDTFLFSNKAGFDRASQDYLLAYSAVAYAQELKRIGYEVLLILDEIQEHISREVAIFKSANVPVPPHNIFSDLYEESGYFEQGSLTTIMINDTNSLNSNYVQQIQKQDKIISSLANVVINFDLVESEHSRDFPKVGVKVAPSNFKFRHYLLNHLSKELAKLLDKIRTQRKTIERKKEQNITVDPWDYYLFYDSEYFMKLLVNSNRYNISQQIIIVQVVLRSVETDTISLFKEEPQVLIQDLFTFAKEYKEFEKKDIYSYVEALLRRDLPPTEVTETIVQSINLFYDKFLTWCKVNDKLLAFRKDYI